MKSNDATSPLPDDVATAISVLGDPINAAVIRYLLEFKQATLGMLLKDTGAPRYALARHLASLEEDGIVGVDIPRGERAGRNLIYTLDSRRLSELYRAWKLYLLDGLENLGPVADT